MLGRDSQPLIFSPPVQNRAPLPPAATNAIPMGREGGRSRRSPQIVRPRQQRRCSPKRQGWRLSLPLTCWAPRFRLNLLLADTTRESLALRRVRPLMLLVSPSENLFLPAFAPKERK